VTAQETPVPDDRHEQDKQAEPDLVRPGEPWRVDHLDQVVVDEPAVVPGLSRVPAQVVLEQRERAGEAGELHQGAVQHGRDVRPDNTRPAPGEEDAAHDEADEQQVDHHHEVRASLVPHLVTCPDSIPSSIGRM
jgi:hypothetical protein